VLGLPGVGMAASLRFVTRLCSVRGSHVRTILDQVRDGA
jgi:hypothetical protein